jgi:cytochrome c oxidase subunit 4
MTTHAQPAPNPAAQEPAHGARQDVAHPLPVRVLIIVYVVLLIFTVLTVAVTYVDLGSINIVVALAIAVIKAALVVLYFMHLRYDGSYYAVILITALMFVSLFIGISLLDTNQYQATMTPPGAIVAPH